MRTKYTVMLALMLCVGAFLFPTAAYAASNDSLTVTASVEGEALRIEASGGSFGVEAIYINGLRFNYRVDGELRVDLLAYMDSEDITVYAVDFAGNVSNVVTVKNPLFDGMEAGQATPPQGIPVTPSNPFTPAGQASVLDNASNNDEKEFFTFSTPAGNVFFLVVDRQRASDNVYFLNAVTEQDLVALAEQAGTEIAVSGGGIPVSATPQAPDEQPETQEAEPTEPPAAESKGGNGTMIFMLIAVGIAGGAGYYFKIVRPKQQGGNSDYDDEDEDEEDIGEEMEFENEAETAEDDRDDDYYDTDADEPIVEDDGL